MIRFWLSATIIGLTALSASTAEVERVALAEGQPLAANLSRLAEALDYLGAPLPAEFRQSLDAAGQQRDAGRLQELLDPLVTVVVTINPESRVKVQRGPGSTALQQWGFTPLLVKVINQSTVAAPLRVSSPQAGPVYAGAALEILKRQAQTELKQDENRAGRTDRFLQAEMFCNPPMTPTLSGLEVEYAILLLGSNEAGRREATLAFDIGQGTQDLGFRGEAPILFTIRPAQQVTVRIRDDDGQPTTARLLIRDRHGRVYPPQPKRLAPDFFFQPQIYRHDGEQILLPPGKFTVTYSRGPEYRELTQDFTVAADRPTTWEFSLQRWVWPMRHGFYCGDHHIHGAGCSHYTMPTLGVRPEDMFAQVKGEGLNVGCVLTWGPCFEFQRQYFSPAIHGLSQPLTLLKYDLEISGFGSAALGHVCLLNLRDQTYPNSDGTKEKGWPSWTVPVLRWCKSQGGVTGYPHSALQVNAPKAAAILLERWDRDRNEHLSMEEAQSALLPEAFVTIDEDRDGAMTASELTASMLRAAERLPNLAVPDMNGGGALEICVSTAEGVCDFISAMDTARIGEWNTWYHLMNCGFPLKVSGETDFPCMSSRRVGQGRVYVQLGQIEQLDFTTWCNGLAAGRSYVSDGYAHALEFAVNGIQPGAEVQPTQPGPVRVQATVTFAPQTPVGVAFGTQSTPEGRRVQGDTVNLHAPQSADKITGGQRTVEIVVNGQVVASRSVPADGKPHHLDLEIPIARSSWVALRQFPQLHTNPVNVLINESPIRVSRASAQWCIDVIAQLWDARHRNIAPAERPAAREAYDRARRRFEQIRDESPLP